MFSKKGIFIVPAYPINEVVDPTGAGDTFAGSFTGSLAAHRKIDEKAVRESLLYGAVVASFCCEAFSLNALARLKRSDVAHRLLALRDMTSCG